MAHEGNGAREEGEEEPDAEEGEHDDGEAVLGEDNDPGERCRRRAGENGAVPRGPPAQYCRGCIAVALSYPYTSVAIPKSCAWRDRCQRVDGAPCAARRAARPGQRLHTNRTRFKNRSVPSRIALQHASMQPIPTNIEPESDGNCSATVSQQQDPCGSMLQVGRNTLARAAAGGIRAGGARLPPAVGCVAAAPAVLRHDAFQGDMGRGSGDLGELGASDLADEADSRSRGPGRVTEAQRGPVAAADADSAADSSLRRLWRWASQAFGLTLELMGDLLRSAQLGLLFLPALVLAAPSFLAGNGTMQRWYSLFATTLEVAGPTFVKLGALAVAAGQRDPPGLVPPV